MKTSNRPRPLPSGRWIMTQRWNDLLFAHWQLDPSVLAPLIPHGLQLDTFMGSAWLGIVPFWMDRIRFRGLPPVPGARSFPELNVRTYVREPHSGTPGVYFLSLDAGSLPAVLFARTMYNLPYYWAEMRLRQTSEREFEYFSRRRITSHPVLFQARYRGLGPSHKLVESRPGTLEYFLTERYCLFTRGRNGQIVRANVHHMPWPLEDAEADIQHNTLTQALGIHLPDAPPVLHYSRRLAVYVWPLEKVWAARNARRVPAAVPST